MRRKKVLVSGCFDLLHSGHVEFLRRASKYGEVYVSIGSDKTIEELKHRPTVYTEQERLFMMAAIKYVKKAVIGSGSGMLDFLPELEKIKPDILLVNTDGDREEKRILCEEKGIKYVVLRREPAKGLPIRSTTELRRIII